MIASQSLGHASVASVYSRGATVSLSGTVAHIQSDGLVFDAGTYDGLSPHRRVQIAPQNTAARASEYCNQVTIMVDARLGEAKV